jgi:hypothetical protein
LIESRANVTRRKLWPVDAALNRQRQLRILSSRLGRIIRSIRRKVEGKPALEEAFALD